MMTKKQKLVKALADLIATHSADDLRYAAGQFDEIAKLATRMADEADRVKLPRKRASTATKRKNKQITPELKKYSEETLTLSRYIDALPSKPSVSLARTLAVSLGLKSDIPKTKQKILDAIYDHLDSLGLEGRITKIETVKSILDRSQSEQADTYERWVSIITKRPKN
jgi:hypothetical protein